MGLIDEVEEVISSDPSKFVFYSLSRLGDESKVVSDLVYKEIRYIKKGRNIVVEIDVNDVIKKRFEIMQNRFSSTYSIEDRGYFLKE